VFCTSNMHFLFSSRIQQSDLGFNFALKTPIVALLAIFLHKKLFSVLCFANVDALLDAIFVPYTYQRLDLG
jgi:hypothetical protein